MAARRRSAGKRRTPPAKGRPRRSARAPPRAGFVGRDPSPILDRYPPKDPSLAPRAPPALIVPPAPAKAPGNPATPSGAAPPAPPVPLLSLERPFSVDEFAEQLGETVLQVTVPREELAEVLRRVSEFMGFGIYVYDISVKPAQSELLKSFVVTLQRVDFRPERGTWAPFEERGRSESPFGPDGSR